MLKQISKRAVTAAIGVAMLIGTASAENITKITADMTPEEIDEILTSQLKIGDVVPKETPKPDTLFSDTPKEEWYYPYLERLVSEGGINGNDDGTFRPNNEMSNAEFIKSVVALVDKTTQEYGEKHWAENYIKRAEELKIIEEGSLIIDRYDEPMTRQAMARVAFNCMKNVYGEEELGDTEQYTAKIADFDSVCDKCKEAVAQAYGKGILTGYEDGSFGGDRTAERCEATTILVRLIDPSYRSGWVDGIQFNAKTDINEKGIKGSKSSEFAMKFFETFKIFEKDGKVTIKGTFPELPQGNEWQFRIEILDKDYHYIGNSSKDAYPSWVNKKGMLEETLMNNTGSFEVQFDFGKDKVEFIGVDLFLCNAETKFSDGGFCFCRKFSENINDKHENYFEIYDHREVITENGISKNILSW